MKSGNTVRVRVVDWPYARRAHAGRTLIELIIAMAIGMVILVGVGSLYLSSSGVSRVANQAGTSEDSGQLLMFVIGEGLKTAGYGEIVGSDFAMRGQTLFDGPVVRGCVNREFADPFPVAPAAPDFSCTGAATPGHRLAIRFQSRYAIVPMSGAELTRATIPDCLGDENDFQNETLQAATARAGSGTTRRIVQNVFAMNGTTLSCQSNGGGGNQPLVNDVIDFTVFYRFDDSGFALTAGLDLNAAPTGGSIRDAAFIEGLAAGGMAWNHVVAVMVCITVASAQQGTSVQTTTTAATRCPRTAVEAESGGLLTESATDGRVRRTFRQVFTVRTQATHMPSITS
jgi:Tfp pilus assembly protein PilW